MAEKDALVDKTVSWVKAGKSGTFKDKKTGEPRKWQMWSFKVDGDERYFTWFENPKTPTPVEGDFIKAAEIECGTYTKNDGSVGESYTAKWINYGKPNTPQKSTQSAPVSTGGTIRLEGLSFYVSYAKDLMVAAMSLNADYGQRAVDALAAEVVEIGKDMCRSAMELPEPEKEPYKPTLGPGDDYPPLGEPPPPEWDR